MSFSVVHGSPQDIWVPLLYGTTIYMGGIVGWDATGVSDREGIQMLPVAAGAFNTTNYDIPFGVAIGHNLRTPVFNTTGKCEYITSATPHDSTTEYVSHGASEYPMGGREAFVKVSIITPCTVLRGSLVDSAVGTAPTVGTVTAGSTDGLSCTTGAMSVATIAGLSTIYFRTGANAGTYRVLDSASTTSHTWDTPTYADVAVGDTAVAVNVLPFGLSRVQLLATYMTCFDIDEACTSDYFGIDVVRLNLAEQYKEYVEFMWNPCNWMPSTSGRVDQYTT